MPDHRKLALARRTRQGLRFDDRRLVDLLVAVVVLNDGFHTVDGSAWHEHRADPMVDHSVRHSQCSAPLRWLNDYFTTPDTVCAIRRLIDPEKRLGATRAALHVQASCLNIVGPGIESPGLQFHPPDQTWSTHRGENGANPEFRKHGKPAP